MLILTVLSVLLAFDVGAFIKALIVWIFAAAIIALACYIIARIVAGFFGGLAGWVWVVWAVGGLIWLWVAWNVLSPMLL